MHRSLAITLAVAFALAACAPEDDDRTDAGEAPADASPPAASAPPAAADRDDVDDVDDDSRDTTPDDDASDDASDDVASIPARFRGEWNGDRAACGSGASETRLRIGANEIRFYESVARVRDVDVESERVIDVTAEFTGEGETWQEERRFTLGADGTTLTDSRGGSLVRYRCP